MAWAMFSCIKLQICPSLHRSLLPLTKIVGKGVDRESAHKCCKCRADGASLGRHMGTMQWRGPVWRVEIGEGEPWCVGCPSGTLLDSSSPQVGSFQYTLVWPHALCMDLFFFGSPCGKKILCWLGEGLETWTKASNFSCRITDMHGSSITNDDSEAHRRLLKCC